MPSAKKTPAKAGKTVAKTRQNETRKAVTSPELTTPTPGRKKKTRKAWPYTHIPPKPEDTARNGRHEGRNLITWTRPRMAEKLLLHIQYECHRYKIDLPWESISHRLHPGSSGGAIMQHFNRLRSHLVAEGHLVPPVCQKPGTDGADVTVRGYIRKYPDSDDTVTTREVPFTEPMEDRKFNLPDAYNNKRISTSFKREQMGGRKRKGKATGAAVKRSKTASPEVDLADLDSDGDYNPGRETRSISVRRSSRSKMTRSFIEDHDDHDDHEELEASFGAEQDVESDDDDDQTGEEADDEAEQTGIEDETEHTGIEDEAEGTGVYAEYEIDVIDGDEDDYSEDGTEDGEVDVVNDPPAPVSLPVPKQEPSENSDFFNNAVPYNNNDMMYANSHNGMMNANSHGGMMNANPHGGMMNVNPHGGMMNIGYHNGMMNANHHNGMMTTNYHHGMMNFNPQNGMMYTGPSGLEYVASASGNDYVPYNYARVGQYAFQHPGQVTFGHGSVSHTSSYSPESINGPAPHGSGGIDPMASNHQIPHGLPVPQHQFGHSLVQNAGAWVNGLECIEDPFYGFSNGDDNECDDKSSVQH